eukprot:s286_g17.t1
MERGKTAGSVPVASESQPEAEATPGASEATGEAADGNPDLKDLFGTVTETSLDLDEAEAREDEYDPGDWIDEDADNGEGPLRTFTGDEEARHRRFMFEQSLSFLPATMPLLPWEQGVFAEIFSTGSTMGLPDARSWTPRFAPPLLPQVEPPTEPGTETSIPTPMTGLPVFAKHVKALEDREFMEQMSLECMKAQACWLGILEGCGFDVLVGNYVGQSLQNLDKERALLHIRDACGVRSPKTVLKRGRDLLLYVRWAERREIEWWPLQEVTLLDYLTEVEKAEKSKFIGKNLVHALKFFKYIFGASFDPEVIIGPLLRGRVSRVLATRNPTEQARALTVLEMKRLEILCKTSPSVYDRYYIGCLLFACYARARWSDLAYMQSFFYDTIEKDGMNYGYVEARTRVHKTSTSEERKAMYMPFVAPIQGVESFCWALEWKEAFIELGLLTGFEPHGAICRAPTVSGGFTKRPLTSVEASDMLNDYLGIGKAALEATSSHSLKATTLAGSFDPDGTRSGWMASTCDEHRQRPPGEVAAPDLPKASGPESVVPSPSLVEADGDISAKPEFDPSNPFQENSWDAQQEDATAQNKEVEDEGPEVICSASSSGEDTTSEADRHERRGLPQGAPEHARERVGQGRHGRPHAEQTEPHAAQTITGRNKLPPADQPLRSSWAGLRVLAGGGASFNWPKCSKCFKDEPKDPDLSEALSSGTRRKMV